MLTGLVLVDGQAIADQRVLLVSGNMTKLLGSTTTGKDGAFEFSVPRDESQGKVILLVKLQGPIVALAHKVIDLDQDGAVAHAFHIDTTGEGFQTVRGQALSTAGWPPYITIFIDPVHLEGIPSGLEKFFDQRDERVVESSFFKMRVDHKEFRVRLRRGVYRIGGDYLNYSRPNLVNPDSKNYVVGEIRADGENRPLEGKRYSGYLLEVERDRDLTMILETVSDQDLSQPDR